MSIFTAAVVREADRWSAAKVSLAGTADVEDVADRVRDVAPTADVALLFVESDDSYLVILRLDHGEDLRVFCSDAAFAEESRMGALLLSDGAQPAVGLAAGNAAISGFDDGDDDEERLPSPAADVTPTGDADLLADYGMPGERLLALCLYDRMLPSDITAEVCQAIGCPDEVEELREV